MTFCTALFCLVTSLLGGVVDPTQVWESTTPAFLPVTNWYVDVPVGNGGVVEITACLHIRSGDVNCCTSHSRLYNKFNIHRVTPVYTDKLGIYSEALWEGPPGYGDQLREFDNSRCWTVVDTAPIPGVVNRYQPYVYAGDGLHVQVAYGSTLTAKWWGQP